MDRAGLRSWIESLGCAETRGRFVFLRDPHWGEAERAGAEAQMALAGDIRSGSEEGWLCVRTGGSGGGVKFARHDEHTLMAAVGGFCRHFGVERVNAVGVLPPWHVSGLMARFRCAATGGDYLDCAWKVLESGNFPSIAGSRWVLSLVPTQLQRLLLSAEAVDWLRQFSVIFIGGGPVWPELADAAAREGLHVALSYGMTETAAMVASQRPAEFLAGDRSSGSALPHAHLRIGAGSEVRIDALSVFRGYFPELRAPGEFETQDLGRIDAAGRLHLLGRADALIITGGRKVSPADVEAALRASGEFEDVVVIGLPDAEWGEMVVACYPATTARPDLEKASVKLATWQRPKRFVALETWPRNAQGKIDRSALRDRVLQQPG